MSVLLDIIEPLGDVSLRCLDKTGKRLESSNFYSWSPVGKPTVIERNGCYKGLNFIRATEVLRHFKFVYDAYSKEDDALTADDVVEFLERLLLYDRARGINLTIVQWDNALIHKASGVKQFITAHENDIIVLHQPPYSPECNPQEEMWHWLKNFIAQASAAKSVQELVTRVKSFEAYIKANAHEVKHRMYAQNYFP